MDERLSPAVAPVIRGLTFDGECGRIVHAATSPAGHAAVPKGLLPSLSLSEEEAKAPERIASAYHAYLSEQSFHAPVVELPTKEVLSVGRSYDEALQIYEAFSAHGGVPSELAFSAATAVKPEAAGEPPRHAPVSGKVAVVTGGAQGFGESIARRLAADGAFVFLADINVEGARRLAGELNGKLGRTAALAVEVDVSSDESVAAMLDTVVLETGGLDLFISNAGVIRAGSVMELQADAFNFVTKVNYVGYFLCAKYASRVMALQGSCASGYYTDIIEINSKSGLAGSNRNAAYAGSKFGGIGLTQSFALELVEQNIKVNAICPGNFFDGPLWSDPEKGLFVQYLRAGKVPGARTVADVKRAYEEKVPMRRGCTGDDVVKAIYYLIDQKYETGQALPVTGGQIMLH